MRRFLTFVTALLALVGLGAGIASAHEEINPKTAVVGQPTFFQLYAANEKTAGLTKITLHAPDGLPFGASTRSPAGWHATVTETAVTWTGGTVAPESFETWGFEIEGADQAKTYTYKVDMGFADGSNESVDVAITAAAAGGGTTATTAGSATTAGLTATTGGTVPAAPVAVTTTKSDGTARTLGIIAMVLALLALALSVVRRSKSAPTQEAGNDW